MRSVLSLHRSMCISSASIFSSSFVRAKVIRSSNLHANDAYFCPQCSSSKFHGSNVFEWRHKKKKRKKRDTRYFRISNTSDYKTDSFRVYDRFYDAAIQCRKISNSTFCSKLLSPFINELNRSRKFIFGIITSTSFYAPQYPME